MLNLQIDPGGEKYYSIAKNKLLQLKEMMKRSGLRAFSQWILINDSDKIFLNSCDAGNDLSFDRIRIFAGASLAHASGAAVTYLLSANGKLVFTSDPYAGSEFQGISLDGGYAFSLQESGGAYTLRVFTRAGLFATESVGTNTPPTGYGFSAYWPAIANDGKRALFFTASGILIYEKAATPRLRWYNPDASVFDKHINSTPVPFCNPDASKVSWCLFQAPAPPTANAYCWTITSSGEWDARVDSTTQTFLIADAVPISPEAQMYTADGTLVVGIAQFGGVSFDLINIYRGGTLYPLAAQNFVVLSPLASSDDGAVIYSDDGLNANKIQGSSVTSVGAFYVPLACNSDGSIYAVYDSMGGTAWVVRAEGTFVLSGFQYGGVVGVTPRPTANTAGAFQNSNWPPAYMSPDGSVVREVSVRIGFTSKVWTATGNPVTSYAASEVALSTVSGLYDSIYSKR